MRSGQSRESGQSGPSSQAGRAQSPEQGGAGRSAGREQIADNTRQRGRGGEQGAARGGAQSGPGAESARGDNRRYGGGIGYGGNVYAPDVIRGIRSTRNDINRMWQRLVDSGHTAKDIQKLVDTLAGIEAGEASALPLEEIRSARAQLQALEAREDDKAEPGERAAFPGVASGSVAWEQLAERYSKRLSDGAKQ